MEASHWHSSDALVCVVPCKCVSIVPPGIAGGCVCNCSLGFVPSQILRWTGMCQHHTETTATQMSFEAMGVQGLLFIGKIATCFTSSFFGTLESPQCTAFRKCLDTKTMANRERLICPGCIPEGVFPKLKNRRTPQVISHHILHLGLAVNLML